jgi:hydroxymethylbilane synthase
MRIGTRASALALAQARTVAAALGGEAELVEITTAGDRGERLRDKSRWTSALEQALLDGRIDLAVHSAKDVPGELADGLVLAAIPPRADPRDALCGAPSLHTLSPGARVGTSSVRRGAQLLALRPDLELVPLRGNVDTRLARLARGELDAIVLAMAGLERLGRPREAGAVLDELVPAPGQGALALEARAGDERVLARARALSHVPTEMCVSAERALARALGASCNSALGAHAQPPGAAGRPMRLGHVLLTGWVGAPDGSAWVRDCLCGSPAQVGAELAERMLAAGAGELLAASPGSPAR